MSIICPNCHYKEIEGSLFCSECGTKLVNEEGLPTASIAPINSPITQTGEMPDAPPPVPTIEATVSLHIVDTGQILPLIGKDEFSVGRVSDGQSILPDIDLSPYDAFNQGVSRLHAKIRIENENTIFITDLGSSNGTSINNNKLPPHQENQVGHGDVIALGRFKIQALIRQEE